jgi:hypothetical protein
MSLPTFEIQKEEIPSGEFSITLQEPNFGTWREARKRYPYPTNNSNQNPGYTTDELLFAMCFVGVNGRSFPEASRDVIDRIERFTIEDKQFLMQAFMEAFFISPAEAKTARALAQELVLADNKLSYTFTKGHLPSGKHTVTFVRPTIGTQMQADRAHQGPEVNGCSLEEFLMSMCITHIDGKEVPVTKDVVSILDTFDILDVQFMHIAFINMFTIDDAQTEKAKSLGKRLRHRSGTTKPAAKAKSTSETIPTDARESI